MSTDCQFDTQVLERRIAAAPDRLFALMTDKDARQRWGAPDESIVMTIDEFDMRTGGREVSRCGPKDAPEFTAVSDFHVVTGPSLLMCTETLTVGGEVVSISLVTQEVVADGTGSLLKVTLQIASLSGADTFADYQAGWTGAMETLTRMAEAETVH